MKFLFRFVRAVLCHNLPSKFRVICAYLYGTALSTDIRFGKNIYIEAPNKVYIGKGSTINSGVHIYTGICNDSKVVIGERVGIGLDSRIITNSHIIDIPEQRWGTNISESVVIEDGVWIGANVTVLPGVTISRGGVIAAGAVVT